MTDSIQEADAQPDSPADSQGRAALEKYWKIEHLSFLLKSVETLAAPDFIVNPRDVSDAPGSVVFWWNCIWKFRQEMGFFVFGRGCMVCW